MECSSLNSYLFRKNIVADPSCQCGASESSRHFFFNCPIHAVARARYLPNNLDDFTLHNLLFGLETKTNQENEELFIKVQEFIINSGRFS